MKYEHDSANIVISKKSIWKTLFGVFTIVFFRSALKVQILNDVNQPIIYLFFEKDINTESDLLELWKDEWSKAGFRPKILTLADARAHPYFGEMEAIVKPIFSDTEDALNFYRYLAMASVGGGWLSEGDTFPTNFPMSEGINLPQDGLLTSYETHVPSLLSGSADEWTRVSRLIIDTIPIMEGRKSELRFLAKLLNEGDSNVQFMPMTNVQIGLVYKAPHQVDCKKMGIGRAVHMAHSYVAHSFAKQLYPIELPGPGPAHDYRADAIKVFLKDWRHQCGGSNAPVEPIN